MKIKEYLEITTDNSVKLGKNFGKDLRDLSICCIFLKLYSDNIITKIAPPKRMKKTLLTQTHYMIFRA